jgi:RimJ/RimL family protein N-acetyltransferase
MKQIIKPITNLPIKNFHTGEEYYLSSFNQPLTNIQLQQLVVTCNQPPIFKFLFESMFGGRKYNLKDAIKFTTDNIRNWKQQKQFTFHITNKDRQIVAMLDIKSPPIGSEIGYWADKNHPGLMTNALKEIINLSKKAGYKSLHTLILSTNQRSINLSKRLGFKYEKEVFEREKYLDKYTLDL